MKTIHLAVAACLAASPLSAHLAEEAASPPPSIKARLEQIRKEARADPQGSARALQGLAAETMAAEERATWVRLSREAALRNGDRDTLLRLRHEADPFALRPLALLLLANASLNEADLPAARAELAQVAATLDHINTRDRRRYWALQARLAQLEGNAAAEYAALDQIVRELPHWPSADCQSCHNDPQNPQVLPLLEIRNTWWARRWIELTQARGDGAALYRESTARLAIDPDNVEARIRQGLASLALGAEAAADSSWQPLPWLALPGRSGPSPRMLFAWP